MPRHRRRKRIGTDEIDVLAGRLFLFPPLPGSKKDLVCYLPPGRTYRRRVWGPDDQWNSDRDKRRDSEFCNQIWKQTGFTVGACIYDVSSSPVDKNGVCKPHMWIRAVYDFAKSKKYERLHFVGYSGGAMLGSSQLVFYPPRPDDPAAKTLILIAPYVAEGLDKAHSNAAFFSDRINARTRLIWGTDDPKAKLGAQVWKEHNANADTQKYTGEHDFCKSGQFENVTRMVTEWLPKATAIKRRKAQ